jgi:hypothetical protein
MRNSDRLRTSVRLRIQKGQVFLRYSGVPTVVCVLLDLSEGGCRCLLPLSALNPNDARAWQRVIEEDRVLNIELHFPPFVNDFPLEAEVRVVEPVPDRKVEVGLKFLNLQADQKKLLGQILLAVAAGKVREAFKPEKASQSGRYLVGARTQAAQMADQIAPVSPEERHAMMQTKELTEASGNGGNGGKDPSNPEGKGSGPLWNNPFHGKRLGEVLVQMGVVTEQEAEDGARRAREIGQRLGRFLQQAGLVKPDEVCRALALQSGLPVADLSSLDTIAPLGGIFPYSLMAGHEFVPLEEARDAVCIAVANPLPKGVIGELSRLCSKRVEVFLAREDHVLLALDHLRPVERHHERRFARFPANIPLMFQLCNRLGRLHEIRCYLGRTLNVSQGGLKVEGEAPGISKPDQIHRRGLCLRLTLKAGNNEIEMLCDPRFIRVREDVGDDEEYPWVFGLRILEMSARDREQFKELCTKLEETGVMEPAP